jgi:hypothetical protein
MVIGSHIFGTGCEALFAAQQAGDAVLERLDPPRRAAVVMALLGLTLIGLFLIVFVMVGGHWVRRLARHRPGRRAARSLPADAQLREALEMLVPDVKSNDTVLIDRPSRDTKVD